MMKNSKLNAACLRAGPFFLISTLIAIIHCPIRAEERLHGIHLKSSQQKMKFELKAPSAERSKWLALYAFGPSSFSFQGKEHLSGEAQEGYYDPYRQIVLLRGIKSSKGKDVAFFLSRGELQFF